MGNLIKLILGLFGINLALGEGGAVDRVFDSDFAKAGTFLLMAIITITLITFIKDLKILK
mgnify:CR=1 FL=1|tara:strand:+ start:367 stop:546 length:180 start_codon:yes stop_codon:yes gene_type:complete